MIPIRFVRSPSNRNGGVRGVEGSDDCHDIDDNDDSARLVVFILRAGLNGVILLVFAFELGSSTLEVKGDLV